MKTRKMNLFHFMHYLHVLIVLLSTSLCNSAFSTYSFGRLGFYFLFYGFYISISLVLSFYFLFYVLNSISMSFLIMSGLTTFFSFLLTLFK